MHRVKRSGVSNAQSEAVRSRDEPAVPVERRFNSNIGSWFVLKLTKHMGRSWKI